MPPDPVFRPGHTVLPDKRSNSASLCKDCSPVHAMSEAGDCPDYHLDNNSSAYQSEALLKDLSYTPDPVSCGHTPDAPSQKSDVHPLP